MMIIMIAPKMTKHASTVPIIMTMMLLSGWAVGKGGFTVTSVSM